ncbi:MULTISPECIES: hypothetical protein [Methylocaldum]|uniref:hypothetical protein n=2 Tax=Methylocaldum TaxID=73778 RepID=UPI00098BCD6C|nr:hypothetical protein [Methylocaldum sp. RMAD-M]MVF23913.1 hypothetical protein [Methylocaldum sp. BRCS4]
MTTLASRTILLVLLTLMQVIAPWVHAHTGGETGGFLHVPGLEFLSKSGETSVQADAPPLDQDVIISVQAGFWGEAGKAKFSPIADDQPCLPSIAASIRRSQLIATPSLVEESPSPDSCFYRNTAPRAPPLNA